MDERTDARTKTFIAGRIIGSDGGSPLDCIVKDLSEGGAKIEVEDATTVPAMFELEIPQRRTAFRAEIRWRYAHLIGVKFIASAQPWHAEEQPTRDELLAENADLLETVRKLAGRLTQLGEPVMLSLKPRKTG